MKTNKPNIVRVKRDERVAHGGRYFYYVMYDRPIDDDFVTKNKDRNYTYILANDELDAWVTMQATLDSQYGKD